MLLPKFDYHRPTSVAETCEVLGYYGAEAKLLAGGTDLLVKMKSKLAAPKHLVGLECVFELEGISTTKGQVTIGGRVTARHLSESRAIRRTAAALAQAAAGLGSPLIRNRATIAGNVITARPAADLLPPLLVHRAKITFASSGGSRVVPVSDVFLGPGETVAKPDEVLTSVAIDRPSPGTGSAYLKLGARQSCEISIVNVAVLMTLDRSAKRIEAARVALGAVAPTPIRCPGAEDVLVGATPSERTFARAGEAAARAARPISDHRATSWYRRRMVEVLARRALTLACDEAERR